eukprot:TRINITY_DN4434_c0_g1_i1.p1 TRINITY_DN4434_c0_g1~~TRINITY_DN4434_c0_g1_i1.p1  ORF type:complete len:169 (+),score=32.21 TRINITY_DN4434_c0_g1_i1:59-508(+)
MTEQLIFVCTGNTCRSVMAHYYAAAALGLGERVGSAGVRATPGAPAATNAVLALAAQGVATDAIEKHSASRLTEERVSAAKYIICMTPGHKDDVLEQFPEHAHKVHTLLSNLSTDADDIVDDPIGDPLETYAATLERMRPSIAYVVDRL